MKGKKMRQWRSALIGFVTLLHVGCRGIPERSEAFETHGEETRNRYTLELSPVDLTKENCMAEASARAERIAANFHVRLYDVVGWGSATACAITISYDADHPIPVLKIGGYSNPFEKDPWYFESIEQCEAAKHSQKEIFRRETGIEPEVFSCFQRRPHSGGIIRSFRITALGVPAKDLRSKSFSSETKEEVESQAQAARRYLEEAGAAIAYDVTSVIPAEQDGPGSPPYYVAVLVYFIPKATPVSREFRIPDGFRRHVSSGGIGRWRLSLDDCQDALDRFAAIAAQLPGVPQILSDACLPTGQTQEHEPVYSVKIVVPEEDQPYANLVRRDTGELPRRSYASCRSRLEQLIPDSKTLGYYCSPNPNDVEWHIEAVAEE